MFLPFYFLTFFQRFLCGLLFCKRQKQFRTWNWDRLNSFINTKKAFKKLNIFILRRFGLFLIHLQSKNNATLGNASNSKPKDPVTQEITVWRKRRQKQNQDRQPVKFANSESRTNRYAESAKTNFFHWNILLTETFWSFFSQLYQNSP